MNDRDAIVEKIEAFRDLCVGFATGTHTEYEKYESARNDVLSEPSIKTFVPDWLIKYRYGSSFWQAMKTLSPHYAPRREFLLASFDEFIDNVRADKGHPMSISADQALKAIRHQNLNELWRKMHDRKTADPEGAITAARTLLETTLKYVLDQEGIAYDTKDDLPALYKSVSKLLNLSPGGHDEELFKQITSGLTSVITGLGRMRNQYGDAHGKGARDYSAEPRHTELAVNLAGSLCTFLIETHRACRPTSVNESTTITTIRLAN